MKSKNLEMLGGRIIVFSLFLFHTLAYGVPYPPNVHGQCLMVGVAGIWWEDHPLNKGKEIVGYQIYRSVVRGEYHEIGNTKSNEFVDIHGIKDKNIIISYKVKTIFKDKEESDLSAPVYVTNNANLIAGGDFEMEEVNQNYRPYALPYAFFGSYEKPCGSAKIVEGGYRSNHSYQVEGHDNAPIIRLHTAFYRVYPGTDYIVEGWVRIFPGGKGSIGGQILTSDFKKCASMSVKYFQSSIIKEDGDWKLFRGHVPEKMPNDAAWIQLWALCWKTRGITQFDDLAIIDKKIERLSRIDPEQKIAAIKEKEKKRKDSENFRKLIELVKEAETLIQTMKTASLTIVEYMGKVAFLDELMQKISTLETVIELEEELK